MTQELTQASTPTDLLSQAIDKGLGVEELGKLMQLQERWEANQARKQFFESFTKFQSEAPDLRKTKQVKFETKAGPPTEYHYAPLGDICKQLNKTLKANDLSYRWEIQDDEKTIKVTCLISHVAGHTERTTMTASPDTSGSKNHIQARGSAIEYMKRYTLIGALGLSTTDSDIDGRLQEVDIDKLHAQYMDIFNQIILKDPSLRSSMDPDNWKTERTGAIYIKAIGKAREILGNLTKLKP